MVEPVTARPVTTASAAGSSPPRTGSDWANEIASWTSPDGLLLHALQPGMAAALRHSGVGAGTEWGPSLQRVLDDRNSVAAFQSGLREGVYDGAKGMLSGTWDLVKGVAWAAYNENPTGQLLDQLRHNGVGVPDWAPSADRVDSKLSAMGGAIGHYVDNVAHGRAHVGDDIKGWIAANWNALKADHARAAAQGPAAEAHWWGQVVGRAGFEVAAVVVPFTKFATVAKAGEALTLALKAGKLGETFMEAARAGKLGELFGAAVKAGKLSELAAEARTAGRLPELIGEARKTAGGLEALAKSGGLSFDEVAAAQKAGHLAPVDATRADALIKTREVARLTAAQTGVARDVAFDSKQLMVKFKHAIDFGVSGNFNSANRVVFEKALNAHLGDPATIAVRGTYRGNPVTHLLNPDTGLNVMRDANGKFISGWKLSEAQVKNVLTHGNLGGG